ncbi:MAG: AAA family ATPase [Deltaproteobacteria bacterium]|nr:AAA family ATPase [Deltaproteobacteria bacterium]
MAHSVKAGEPLAADELYRSSSPDSIPFATTAELDAATEFFGQGRALDAVRFGIGIAREGYNIFALGPSGTGRHFLVEQVLRQRAGSGPAPQDQCYVHNFDEPHRPRSMRLPAGVAVRFRKDMERLVEELRPALSAALESEEYRTRRQVIEEQIKERQEKAFGELEERAKAQSFALLRTPMGLVLAPLREGEILSPGEFQKLPETERRQKEEQLALLQRDLQELIRKVPQWEHEARERLRELNREITGLAFSHLMRELRERYRERAEIVAYLDAVERDLVENARNLLASDEPPAGAPHGASAGVLGEPPWLRRYRVNVLVDHGASSGAPVVYEANPSCPNLIGRVEHLAQMGALVTDFTLIKPGALHRANGGYLVLDALRVLLEPFAWEALKRALQSRQLRIESVGQLLSLVSTVSLEPEPVPLDVKVVLIGDRRLYYLLCEADPDFSRLFKVAADFEDDVERTPESEADYARLVATLACRERLRPFDRGAVARMIEQGSRAAGDAEKLSARTQGILDLLREADYWAGEAGRAAVTREDVEHAIDAQIARSDRVRGRLLEEVLRETLLVDTDGGQIGQVNGLSVLQLGGFAFGHPSRITARVRPGKGEIVDIEREVELGGPIHSKGVLILAGFIGGRYARERPLSLSASLVFEQSYGGVEGDSASAAELFALLSAIAEVPLRQSLAVTGSVNQHGRLQAIGGVNEKIEGFFDLCRARGLTGAQGVLIPVANVKHLMLRRDVVEAARAGRFRVYPVESVDGGMEILTGLPAGERDGGGGYPEGSINSRVESRLARLAQIWSAQGEKSGRKAP